MLLHVTRKAWEAEETCPLNNSLPRPRSSPCCEQPPIALGDGISRGQTPTTISCNRCYTCDKKNAVIAPDATRNDRKDIYLTAARKPIDLLFV